MENSALPTSSTTFRKPAKLTTTTPEKGKLLLSPYALAKMRWFCQRDAVEISGFGITDKEFRIVDFMTTKQTVSGASIDLDILDVGRLWEDLTDQGLTMEQFGRIWLHTHPGNSNTPSSTDEETFHKHFGNCSWNVMAIMGRDGAIRAEIRFTVGPGGHAVIPVEIDWNCQFPASNQDAWEKEYQDNIKIRAWTAPETPMRSWQMGGQCEFDYTEGGVFAPQPVGVETAKSPYPSDMYKNPDHKSPWAHRGNGSTKLEVVDTGNDETKATPAINWKDYLKQKEEEDKDDLVLQDSDDAALSILNDMEELGD